MDDRDGGGPVGAFGRLASRRPEWVRASRDEWAETWAVATFDLVALSLVVVLVTHASGFLAGSLSGFGTLPGVLVFGYLWLVVVVGIRWVLAAEGLYGLATGSVRTVLTRSAAGGAFAGGGFFFGLVLVAGVAVAVTSPDAVVAVAIVAVVGTAVAAVVGAVVGVVAGVLDVLLYRTSGRLLPRERTGGDAEDSDRRRT